MKVCIDETRQDAFAAQVEHLGSSSQRRARTGFVPDGKESAAPDGNSAGAGSGGVHGVEAAVHEEKITVHAGRWRVLVGECLQSAFS